MLVSFLLFIRCLVFLVRLDDLLNQLVAHYIPVREIHEPDALDAFENFLNFDEPGTPPAREVDPG